MKLANLLVPLCIPTVSAFVIPFLPGYQDQQQDVLKNEPIAAPPVSYKTVKPEDWPLDLTKYEPFKIVRFDTQNSDVLSLRTKYDQWEANAQFVDFKIPTEDLDKVQGGEIIIDNLAQLVFESYPNETGFMDLKTLENEGMDIHALSDIFFKEYRPLATIYSWLDLLKETFPDLVTIEWLGQTFEGRDMKAIHLSSPAGLNRDKKTIVITGGVHAREWISVSTALFTIFNVLKNYGSSAKETKYLNHLDFLIIPVFNPDGYEYTWNSDRLWRKNRQETYVPKCFGIDIDHSFAYHWTRSEDFPCGESYSGETKFEAMEAYNLHHYINITKNDHDIYGFLDFHSYTQKILYPYAYSCDELPRDHENLVELAYGLSKAIRLRKGKYYDVEPACLDRGVDVIPGLGAGTSLDYMYNVRADWAFQLKLRDTGSHGFLLPSNYITPVGKEIYAAVKYFCEFILSPDL